MQLETLYKLKIAALLHDPPHKPYLMIKGKSHEEATKELVKRVFGDEIAKLLSDERIRNADKIASSFDRWPLSILMGEKYIPGAFPVEELKLKNIVSPNMEEKLERKFTSENYENYINRLYNVLNYTGDWKLKYHTFYALYELLWIANDLPVGPADTRVPTHTVFDHNYATAAMVNWAIHGKDKFGGLLVGLDVASVQEFITSSRKLRDAWASSYIVSALTWYTIVELVDKLGPDIVLMPSLRMNPFYLHWLEARLNEGARKALKDARDLIYLTPKIKDMYESLGIPPYPVVPGRVTLVLPPWSLVKRLLGIKAESPDEYFKERFRRGWELLWRIAEGYASIAKDKNPLWKLVARVFEYYRRENFGKYSFDKVPPLELRVAFVEIDADGRREDLWRVYDRKYEELAAKIGFMKYRRKSPDTEVKLHELTVGAFDGKDLGFPSSSGRGFDYCTCCGKIPAMLIIPRDENWYKKEIEKFIGKIVSKGDLVHIKIVLAPGEKLCPWCFLKRVLSLEPRILKSLLMGLKHDEEVIKKFITEAKDLVDKSKKSARLLPSTSDVASVRLEDMLICAFESELEKGIELLNYLMKNWRSCLPLRWSHDHEPSLLWPFEKVLVERVKKLKLSDKYRSLLLTIIALDPEELWFHSERRRCWTNLLGRYDLGRFIWRYYALVRADGDSIGDILEGRLTAFLTGVIDEDIYYGRCECDKIEEAKCFLKNYIVYSCEGDYREFISKVVECIEHEYSCRVEELAQQLVKSIGVALDLDEAKKRVERVLTGLKSIFDESRIPVTPAYHVTISSALMRATLFDIALITENDGFVVYAGGDDLLAFVPVDKALDVVRETRLSWGGLEVRIENVRLSNGFLIIKRALLPMLPNIGRSYCIYIAHYHYPLSSVLSRSIQLLYDAKDKYLLTYFDSSFKQRTSGKDVLVIAYSPRGREEFTMLPLSWHRPIVRFDSCSCTCRSKLSYEKLRKIASLISNAKKLLEYVEERVSKQAIASHSLLYELTAQDIKDLLITLIDRPESWKALNTIKSLIRYVVERNTILPEKARDVFGNVFEPLLKTEAPEEPVGLGYFKVKRESREERGMEEMQRRKKVPLLINLVDAVKLIRSGMR